jgi:hypothetical protein
MWDRETVRDNCIHRAALLLNRRARKNKLKYMH